MKRKQLHLQLKLFLSSYGRYLLVGCLVASLVGGWVAYTTVLGNHTQTERQVESNWTTTGQFTHTAQVHQQNPVFPVGRELDNRTLYYTNISERVKGKFVFNYTASGDGNLSADVIMTYFHRSKSDDGRVLWSKPRMTWRNQSTLAPGTSIRIPFTLNMSAEDRVLSVIQQRLGATVGKQESQLEVVVRLNGTVNGHQTETTRTYVMEIQPEGNVYRVDNPGLVRETRQTTRLVQVSTRPGLGAQLVALAMFVLPLCSAVLIALADRTDAVSVTEADRRHYQFELQREVHDDWIISGTITETPDPEAIVAVESLEKLVDAAIAAESRVVEDGDRYVVFDGDTMYRFDSPVQDSLEEN